MNSSEMNARIGEICDKADEYGFAAFGGKTIPYIGWFWRSVDFDAPDYDFGVMPPYRTAIENNPTMQIGFMENNKWGYGYVHANDDQWSNIKRLLCEALENTTADTLKAVNDAIQAIQP